MGLEPTEYRWLRPRFFTPFLLSNVYHPGGNPTDVKKHAASFYAPGPSCLSLSLFRFDCLELLLALALQCQIGQALVLITQTIISFAVPQEYRRCPIQFSPPPPKQVRGFGIKKFPEDMDAVLELKQKQLNLVEKKQAKVKKSIIIISR